MTVEAVQTLNYFAALGSVLLLSATILIIGDFFTYRKLARYVDTIGVEIALAFALFGSFLTLVYSEVVGYIPCGFCWFERMMLYPQVIILFVALYFKERVAPRYGIALSVIGFVLSLYHHYIQMGGSQFVTCPTAGDGADCAKRLIFEFGFVTFPLMATILFGFLTVLYFYILKTRNHSLQLVE